MKILLGLDIGPKKGGFTLFFSNNILKLVKYNMKLLDISLKEDNTVVNLDNIIVVSDCGKKS